MKTTNNVSKQRGSSSPRKMGSPKVPAGTLESKNGALRAASLMGLSVLEGGYGLDGEKGMGCTPEEIIGAMHDRNENFRGQQANFEKIRLYQAVKRDLVKFKERCDDVRVVDGFDPNIREKHAMLWIDFSFAATLDKKETAALTAIMKKADDVVISAVGDHTRISFFIRNIWEK